MMKLLSSLMALAALIAYLLLWPTGMEPVAWTAPPAPKLEGVYAYNEKLKGIQRLAEGIGVGPDTVNVDAVGRVYTGYADGRIEMFSPNGATYSDLADTGGRPLGITFGPNGGLVIADAKNGLLHLGSKVTPLVSKADGVPFGFTNDADNTRLDKNIYFTDASWKFGYGDARKDILEHGANGRLLEYNVVSKQVRVLMKDLHFPNGVAVGPGDAYVLVNETAEYRILRYWLKGEKTGTWDVFIDNLPGFPDNLSFNDRDRFWVALYAPRFEMLDRMLPGGPFLKHLSARLPEFLQPGPDTQHAFVLGINLDGRVVSNLQYRGRDAYAPITSVREHGPWLYFGSLTQSAVGRLPLNRAVEGAMAPPPGWEQLPPVKQLQRPKGRAELEEEEEERRERSRERSPETEEHD